MTSMKSWLRAACAAAAMGLAATAAQAQTVKAADGPVLIVEGDAQLEHAPDWALLSITLRGEGKTQVDAVAAMSALRDRVESDLANLPNAPVVGIGTGALDVEIVRGKDCGLNSDDAPMPDHAVLSQGVCAPIGAVAKVELRLKISPATRLGEVAAHTVAAGAERPDVVGSGVTDMDALKREAMRQALAEAQGKAEAIASASGRKLAAVTQNRRRLGARRG